MIQNFERKERGNGDGIISGKIVVTCRVTIDGMGSHSGLGEEWADNENAGTSGKPRHSSAPAPALDWDDISTIWMVIGSIWTSGSSRSPGHGYPIGLSKAEAGGKWTSKWSRPYQRQRAPEVAGAFSSGPRRTPDKGEVPS